MKENFAAVVVGVVADPRKDRMISNPNSMRDTQRNMRKDSRYASRKIMYTFRQK